MKYCNSVKRIVAARVRGQRIRNHKRKYKQGPCTLTAVMPNNVIAPPNSPILKGEIIASVAGWISRTEKEVLGTAHVGKRLLLWNRRGSRRRDHTAVHRKPRKRRREEFYDYRWLAAYSRTFSGLSVWHKTGFSLKMTFSRKKLALACVQLSVVYEPSGF